MRKEREGKVMRLVAICKALVSEGYVARKEKGKNARAIFLAYLTPTLHKLISLSEFFSLVIFCSRDIDFFLEGFLYLFLIFPNITSTVFWRGKRIFQLFSRLPIPFLLQSFHSSTKSLNPLTFSHFSLAFSLLVPSSAYARAKEKRKSKRRK